MIRRAGSVACSAALDLVYVLLLPFLLVLLLVVSRCLTRPKLRRGLAGKLWGVPLRTGSRPCFWLHAVSVGEVMTSLPLIAALRQRYPDWDLGVSVSTFTGFDAARKRLQEVMVFYFPLDVSVVVRRFFKRLRPTVVILMELELWPNFLLAARRRGIPVLVANGRMTSRSAGRYRLGGPLARRFFALVGSYGVQNERYRERFLSLGIDPARIEVLGNLKHDRKPSVSPSSSAELRALLGWREQETVALVAGSTHPGEEKIVCAVYRELRQRDGRLRLVVAPRHVERINASELERWEAGGELLRWSSVRQHGLLPPGLDLDGRILLVDTVGELERFYSMGDIVFVGGSLVPHGGHNIFEAASLGKPVLFGPHYGNFQEEGDLLLAGGAALRVDGPSMLAVIVERLLGRPDERRLLGEKALAVTARLQGATQRHVEWLQRHLRLSLGAGPG